MLMERKPQIPFIGLISKQIYAKMETERELLQQYEN